MDSDYFTICLSSFCGIIGILIQVFIVWRITKKAGFSGCLSLLAFIPLVNVLSLILFAFLEWPVEAEIKKLRNK